VGTSNPPLASNAPLMPHTAAGAVQWFGNVWVAGWGGSKIQRR
jgi:hypothetical protein